MIQVRRKTTPQNLLDPLNFTTNSETSEGMPSIMKTKIIIIAIQAIGAMRKT